mgnify:CR=1 FL=1
MTTLRDMPMISVEQKNAFREAALKVEAELTQVETSNHTIGRQMGEVQEMLIQVREERDTLAAWLEECLSAMRHASEFLDESDKDAALALHRMNSLSSRSRGQDASLACRDARMKAEALEDFAACYEVENDLEQVVMDHLRDGAKAYRKQAEGES